MDMTAQARTAMEALGDHFASAGFPSPWQWFIAVDEVEGTSESLNPLLDWTDSKRVRLVFVEPTGALVAD